MENPSSLDKPIGYWDEDYADYTDWLGRLEIADGMICLSYEPSDIVGSEMMRARVELEREQAREAVERRRQLDAEWPGMLPN